ncbi:MAG: MotA/TolQ/ExbB proton channel family protein [Prevotella sp.]|nr:MotA/TolQ/ExbB proton channel family protein [Prevotella sp.]
MKNIYREVGRWRWALLFLFLFFGIASWAQGDSLAVASHAEEMALPAVDTGLRQVLKTKFIEGNAAFMSLVALALVLGLSLCIERIVFLTLSTVNTSRFMADLRTKLSCGDVASAKVQCEGTRGPVAAVCRHALEHIDEPMDEIERSLGAYASVEAARLERGCSWIKLFIAMAPSLGFLGTVIGMVMAFDQIQQAHDIGPSIVAAGMKVALITTIFGIIVALILQLFYNYILSRIDRLVDEMQESSISLLDQIAKTKKNAE